MKYEGLSKCLVKLNQWFASTTTRFVILGSGHRLCLVTIGKN
jgi:hypothetical protein